MRSLAQFIRWNLSKLVDVRAAEALKDAIGRGLGTLVRPSGRKGIRLEPCTLHDGTMEQASCPRDGKQCANRDGAGRLAEDRHIARIATEGGNIGGNPFESGDVVEHP